MIIDDLKPEGTFNCPHCGQLIDPEDTSDRTYTVENVDVTNNSLELTILCQCGEKTILEVK